MLSKSKVRDFIRSRGYAGQVAAEYYDKLETKLRLAIVDSFTIPTNRKKLKDLKP